MKTRPGVVLGLALLALLGVPRLGWAHEPQLSATTPIPSSHPLASVPDDAYWDDRFAPLGVDGPVYAIAVNGDAVYIGGAFTAAGGIVANGMAKWDTLTNMWSALGDGVQQDRPYWCGTVRAIAVSGNDVYIGGSFYKAGDVTAYNVAKWNAATQTWSAVGSGFDTTVTALASSNGNVYAGGNAKTWSVPLVARWDGCVWSSLGSGVNNSVSDIAASGDDVYVVGSFTIAGKPSAHIGHWNKPTAPTQCHIYYFPLVSK